MSGDIIVCGEGAQLRLPEAKLGMMPGGGGTQTLTRLMGKPLAKELMSTGRRLSAAEAREFKLVNMRRRKGRPSRRRAGSSPRSARSPMSVMLIKQAVDRVWTCRWPTGSRPRRHLLFAHVSEDREEGLKAFRGTAAKFAAIVPRTTISLKGQARRTTSSRTRIIAIVAYAETPLERRSGKSAFDFACASPPSFTKRPGSRPRTSTASP